MKKTYCFLLTAGILLALAFTISCSSDNDDGDVTPSSSSGDVNLSELASTPQDLQGYEGTGIIPVFMEFEGTEIRLPAGQIQNGKLSLNLPSASAVSDYLMNLPQGISASPSTLRFAEASLVVEIPGEVCGNSPYQIIRPYYVNSSGSRKAGGGFLYASATGTVTGTTRIGMNINSSLLQGWNMIINDGILLQNGATYNPPAGTTLQWWIICDDSLKSYYHEDCIEIHEEINGVKDGINSACDDNEECYSHYMACAFSELGCGDIHANPLFMLEQMLKNNGCDISIYDEFH